MQKSLKGNTWISPWQHNIPHSILYICYAVKHVAVMVWVHFFSLYVYEAQYKSLETLLIYLFSLESPC